jgi:EmrB/QacA subfamily drug resistance transporter
VRALIYDPEKRKWFTLAAVSFGLFMIMLDNTVVNVALPAIQRDLHIGLSELEWIVAGYALTFAALILSGGKLADRYGRRRIFVLGIVVFTLASLACGLASGGNELIAARIVQGVGAALMNPATLAIISATFPPKQRGMAIGIWAGVSALALAIGPLVGGLITEHASWNWIFFINVPIGIVGVAASYLLIDESRDMREDQRLDVPGLLTSGLGLFALEYGLIEANTYGWTSGRILGAFFLAAVLLAAFVLIEIRGRHPMLDVSLFRNTTYTGANIVMLLVALAMFGVFFFVSLYMQNVLGYSAVQAGAAFLPMTVLIVLVAPVTGRLSDKYGSRWFLTGGLTLLGIQLVYFSQLGGSATYWELLPAFLIGGVGMAMTMTPATAAAMRAVPVDRAGVGSAVLNAARQVGGSLGIALMGAIVAASVSISLQAAQKSHNPAVLQRALDEFVNGFSNALIVAGCIAFAGAVVAAVLVRHEVHEEPLQPPATFERVPDLVG